MMKNGIIGRLSVLILLSLLACNKEDEPLSKPEDDAVATQEDGFVYASNAGSTFDIWMSKGSETTQLTHTSDAACWWPRISADKTKILYYMSDGTREINDFSTADLMVMDADGSNQEVLIASGANGWEQQGLANWSPDGRSIVLAAVDSVLGTWQIYTVDDKGQAPTRISPRANANYLDPIFDPSGNSIICATIPQGLDELDENIEIVRLNIGDSTEVRLTFNSQRDHHPTVSPDGSSIVFESLVDPDYLSIGKWALRKINLATGDESELLNNEHINLFPRYSRSGSYVLYTRLNVESFEMTIGKIDLRTNDRMLILNEDAHSLNPDPFE